MLYWFRKSRMHYGSWDVWLHEIWKVVEQWVRKCSWKCYASSLLFSLIANRKAWESESFCWKLGYEIGQENLFIFSRSCEGTETFRYIIIFPLQTVVEKHLIYLRTLSTQSKFKNKLNFSSFRNTKKERLSNEFWTSGRRKLRGDLSIIRGLRRNKIRN